MGSVKSIPDRQRENQATDRERLLDAVFENGSIGLEFGDSEAFTLPIEKIGMPVDRILWDTATATSDGKMMVLKGVKGEDIPIEATTLRYLVDPDYTQKIDADLTALQFSRNELEEMAKSQSPPAFLDKPSVDLRRDSWK